MISRNPDNGTSAGASRDYAIMISRNPNNGASAGAYGDYAVVISRNPDNGAWAGGASHQRKAAMNNGEADNAQHLPVLLPLQRQRHLLGKGDPYQLIYVR